MNERFNEDKLIFFQGHTIHRDLLLEVTDPLWIGINEEYVFYILQFGMDDIKISASDEQSVHTARQELLNAIKDLRCLDTL